MNKLYHIKYTGGVGRPLEDFPYGRTNTIKDMLISKRQVAGEPSTERSFIETCVSFSGLVRDVPGRNVSISDICMRPEDRHQFLIFVTYDNEESWHEENNL